MNVLTATEVSRKLKTLPLWKVNTRGTEIRRTYLFPDFRSALRFVNKVGKLAETADHHPELVLSYGKVKITLTTHSARGVTDKDIALAIQIDA